MKFIHAICAIFYPPVRWDHDYSYLSKGKVVPFGVYDLSQNKGTMILGDSRETPRFVGESLVCYWEKEGIHDWGGAKEMLLLSDSGGGCSKNCYMFKEQIQILANVTGATVRVAHYPPGSSKWNKIEHRMFCHVSHALRGTVFETHEQVAKLMERTTTKTGLNVRCHLNLGEYPTKEKASEEFFENYPLYFDEQLPELNYVAVPENKWDESGNSITQPC